MRQFWRAETAFCSRSASRLRARSTSTAGTRSRLSVAIFGDQLTASLDGIDGDGILAAIHVDVEVGLGGHEQGVVLGRLDVPARRN